MTTNGILNTTKIQFEKLICDADLVDTHVSVLVKTLTPEEAIGVPGRRDFPIIIGKERVIETTFCQSKSHVFTDSPGEFIGNISTILDYPLTTNRERAIYIGTLNAALKHLNLTQKTIHCRDEEPEDCAIEIAAYIHKKFGEVLVGLIGLNPAIADRLIDTFGKRNIRVTDLDEKHFNVMKSGVEIWNGNDMTADLISRSDIVVITGTTLVNDTFDSIMDQVRSEKKEYLIYGVTCAGICSMMGFNRICPKAS